MELFLQVTMQRIFSESSSNSFSTFFHWYFVEFVINLHFTVVERGNVTSRYELYRLQQPYRLYNTRHIIRIRIYHMTKKQRVIKAKNITTYVLALEAHSSIAPIRDKSAYSVIFGYLLLLITPMNLILVSIRTYIHRMIIQLCFTSLKYSNPILKM